MTEGTKEYLKYGVLGLGALVVFAVSIWGGYRFTLNQRQKNTAINQAPSPPAVGTIQTVSEDTQVVNVDSLPTIYFQYAYNLTDEIWFSELTFEEVIVVEPPSANDETTMVVDYAGKRVELPFAGSIGLKIGEGEGKYSPAKVRDLGQAIAAGDIIRVGMLFTPVEVTASAEEIQAKLKDNLDSASDFYDVALLNIAKRGVRKLSQAEIVQRLHQDETIVFQPEEMLVSSIETR